MADSLNFKTFGQGSPIIILHGLFGTLDNWQTIAKSFAENHTVYIIDQRNHGRSPHYDDISYSLMAEDLRVFMEENWLFKANLIGHSMGGKTVMQFAFDNPDMVEKLIVVDISPQRYVGNHEAIFEALFSVNLETLGSRKEAEAILKTKIENRGVLQFLLKNLTRDKGGKYSWKMNLEALYKNYDAILAEVTGPRIEVDTLFISGGASNYITESSKEVIGSHFANYTLEVIEDAGHWVHAESPKKLFKLVTDFINSPE